MASVTRRILRNKAKNKLKRQGVQKVNKHLAGYWRGMVLNKEV